MVDVGVSCQQGPPGGYGPPGGAPPGGAPPGGGPPGGYGPPGGGPPGGYGPPGGGPPGGYGPPGGGPPGGYGPPGGGPPGGYGAPPQGPGSPPGYGYPPQNGLVWQGGPPDARWGIEPVSGLPYSDKEKMVAFLLEFLLAPFGAGRFYTGHTGIAIAQIAVSFLTCGIGSIWPLIDSIMMALGKVPDSEGRPLRG